MDLRARANRVSYHQGALEEWWANGPLGLEQGFTVRSAPARVGSGPLTLELAPTGNLHPSLERGGDGIALVSRSCATCGCLWASMIRDRVRALGASVTVVAPAINSRLRLWIYDEDGARAAAEVCLARCLSALEKLGVSADGEVGDADPIQAIADSVGVTPFRRPPRVRRRGHQRRGSRPLRWRPRFVA